jgi:DNA modification methylase
MTLPSVKILVGDCIEAMRAMPDASVQCCVTSPPYYGLRDYGHAGQIGLEATPSVYVAKMAEVFEEVRRVLRVDGTLWLNLGDSYARNGGKPGGGNRQAMHMEGTQTRMLKVPAGSGLKEKDLIGIPWRVAFALQAAGWWLREDIIWSKPNCMPESVTDRCTRSHEYIFHLSKSAKYYHDAEAIKEPGSMESIARYERGRSDDHKHVESTQTISRSLKHMADKQRGHSRKHAGFNARWDAMEKAECGGTRNKRSVWTVAPANYPDAHFATFPPDLIKPCILAGTKPGDVVIDPFGGSGTTGMVSLELGRSAILCELNPAYAQLAFDRCNVMPGMALEGVA